MEGDNFLDLISDPDELDGGNSLKNNREAALAAWNLRKIAGGVFAVALIDAVILVNLWGWIWVENDMAVWNYVIGWHVLMVGVAFFVGMWRDDIFATTFAFVAVSSIGLLLDVIGIWWRDEDTEGIAGLHKQRRKEALLAYQVILMIISLLYIILGAVMLARLDAAVLGRFFGRVDQELLLTYYSLQREQGYVERALEIESPAERDIRLYREARQRREDPDDYSVYANAAKLAQAEADERARAEVAQRVANLAGLFQNQAPVNPQSDLEVEQAAAAARLAANRAAAASARAAPTPPPAAPTRAVRRDAATSSTGFSLFAMPTTTVTTHGTIVQ